MYAKIIPVLLVSVLVLTMAVGAQAQGIKNLSAEELKGRLDQPGKIVVVDTRTVGEYRQGHISGAVNIPPESFDRIAVHLPKERNVPLVFYCRGYD